MGSINAQKFAYKLAEKVRTSKTLINKGKLAKELGYSDSVAKHPDKITKTQSFKTAIVDLKAPLIEGLLEQINKVKLAINSKNLEGEELRVLTYTFDTMVKNYQLLSGGATERQVLVLPSEVLNKNNIATNKDIIE